MVRYLLTGMVTASLLGMTVADDKKADVKSEPLRSKLSEPTKSCLRATSVNFTKELGVPLEYLSDVGYTVYKARVNPDPVALAFAAQSLSIAERVSGKKASLTADEIMQEAIELAVLRGVTSELEAMVLIVPADATKKELAKQIDAAKKREEEAKAIAKSGEASKEILDSLTVSNQTDECLKIYVSGKYVGEVHKGQTARFHVHDHSQSTRLEAKCEQGHLVRAAYAHGHNHNVSWEIKP